MWCIWDVNPEVFDGWGGRGGAGGGHGLGLLLEGVRDAVRHVHDVADLQVGDRVLRSRMVGVAQEQLATDDLVWVELKVSLASMERGTLRRHHNPMLITVEVRTHQKPIPMLKRNLTVVKQIHFSEYTLLF